MRIRPACEEDIPAVARVHVDAWKSTYRGIMADAFLDRLSYARCEAVHRRDLALPGAIHFVADLPGEGVVGFVSGGRERSGDARFSGELYAIYIREQSRGRGLGTALVRHCAAALRRAGMNAALVWVLADNTPAVAFYQRRGGRLLREQAIEIGGAQLRELAYGWEDLSLLEPAGRG